MMKNIKLLILPLLALLFLLSCKHKQANPVGEMLLQEIIENSPGANRLVGEIVRAVDCGLGGLAEGVFKEGTIRLEEMQQELVRAQNHVSSYQQDDNCSSLVYSEVLAPHSRALPPLWKSPA